jgi:hypothetical protein
MRFEIHQLFKRKKYEQVNYVLLLVSKRHCKRDETTHIKITYGRTASKMFFFLPFDTTPWGNGNIFRV